MRSTILLSLIFISLLSFSKSFELRSKAAVNSISPDTSLQKKDTVQRSVGTGITERSFQGKDNTGFKIYPNPCQGIFTLSIENVRKGKIEIQNVIGVTFYQLDFVGTFEKNIDISQYVKGLYFVKITNQNSASYHKIIYE
jgi:hypothetical protein